METKIYNIYLDAGHGRHTTGKCSPDNSVTEWDLNNKVCLFIANNLVKYNCNEKIKEKFLIIYNIR